LTKKIKSDILFISPRWGYERKTRMNEEHRHQHQDTKKIIDRMSRVIGHMESIKRMVEEGRDCSEVLIQISAVRSAINNVGKIILQDHINNCIVDAVKTGDKKVLDDLNSAVAKFMK
jgi:DNA-binding FrmR family transcriptional regulator